MFTPYALNSDEQLDTQIEQHAQTIAKALQTAQTAKSTLDDKKPQVIVDLEDEISLLREQLRLAESKHKNYVGKWKSIPEIRELHEKIDLAQSEIAISSKHIGMMLTEKRLRKHVANLDFDESNVPLGMIELDGQIYHIQSHQVAMAGWYCSTFDQARRFWDYAEEKDILHKFHFEVQVKADTEVTTTKDMNALILELIKSPSPPPVTFKPQIFKRENRDDLSPFYLRKVENE